MHLSEFRSFIMPFICCLLTYPVRLYTDQKYALIILFPRLLSRKFSCFCQSGVLPGSCSCICESCIYSIISQNHNISAFQNIIHGIVSTVNMQKFNQNLRIIRKSLIQETHQTKYLLLKTTSPDSHSRPAWITLLPHSVTL